MCNEVTVRGMSQVDNVRARSFGIYIDNDCSRPRVGRTPQIDAS